MKIKRALFAVALLAVLFGTFAPMAQAKHHHHHHKG